MNARFSCRAPYQPAPQWAIRQKECGKNSDQVGPRAKLGSGGRNAWISTHLPGPYNAVPPSYESLAMFRNLPRAPSAAQLFQNQILSLGRRRDAKLCKFFLNRTKGIPQSSWLTHSMITSNRAVNGYLNIKDRAWCWFYFTLCITNWKFSSLISKFVITNPLKHQWFLVAMDIIAGGRSFLPQDGAFCAK